jgi:hypothetical protein
LGFSCHLFIADPPQDGQQYNCPWEQSLLAIGCEAVAKVVNAPAQESRADFIAGKPPTMPEFSPWGGRDEAVRGALKTS